MAIIVLLRFLYFLLADFGIRIPVLQDAFSSSGQTENFSFVCLSSCMMIARKKTSLCAELHYKDQILSKVCYKAQNDSKVCRQELWLFVQHRHASNIALVFEKAFQVKPCYGLITNLKKKWRISTSLSFFLWNKSECVQYLYDLRYFIISRLKDMFLSIAIVDPGGYPAENQRLSDAWYAKWGRQMSDEHDCSVCCHAKKWPPIKKGADSWQRGQ